ncbi:heterokaryon incompatibility protein-domain-containing protein [Halenospora varia]|nr:heterokaryon incompatibility protein-domain-containing protein [Halenospora varia]
MANTTDIGQVESPYRGQTLGPKNVRLLTIDSTKGTLHLRAERHELANIVEYDAISYVWGTAEASVRVLCNDGSLQITPRAYEMLEHLHLHRPVPTRLLWIDAICINQTDLDEKAVQVPLMHQIYSKAASVVVWMGPAIPQTQAFMTDFDRMTSLVQMPMYKLHVRHTDFVPPPFRTFQEIILAVHKAIVLCGSFWVDLDDFVEFVVNGFYSAGEYISYNATTASNVPGNPRKSDLVWEGCRTIQRYRDSFFEDNTRCVDAVDIPLLLNILRPRKVKKPVDRIWAISGLLERDFQRKLAPLVDYSETGRAQYWRTYVRFAKTLIEEQQSLGLLCIPPSVESNEDIPSWCPDLSGQAACLMTMIDYWNYPTNHPGQPGSAALTTEDDEEACKARVVAIQRHPQKLISTVEDDEFLRVRGFVVDTISDVIEDSRLLGKMDYIYNSEWATMSFNNPTHVAAIDFHTRALELARSTFYGTYEGVSDIPPEYLMAFNADCRINEHAETAYRDALSMFTSCDPSRVTNLEMSRRKRAFECIGTMKSSVGFSFFATGGGRLGLAVPGCKAGDKVCVFYGGHPLHILRWPSERRVLDVRAIKGPAKFYGIAFVPHLMEPHQSDAARLASDEIFVIG